MTKFTGLALFALLALALAGCSTTPDKGAYSSLPTSPKHPARPDAAEATQPAEAPPPLPAVPDLPHEQYTDVLDRIRSGYGIPDVQHYAVDRELEAYRSRPDFLDRTFRRGARYLHYIVTELERRNMPLELALLPVVESAFNPVAYSRSRASGLWQFIPSTGKHYGLQQNWWIDERRDVLEATNAALDYLQYLHRYFNGDWYLAIAAYNGGEGTVSRAVARNGNSGRGTDFFSLSLKAETRDYVPKLLAIRRLVGNPEAYGLQFAPIPNQPYFEVVDPGRQVHLGQAADLAGISRDDMFALNPAFNRMTTPPNGPHRLLLPVEYAEPFRLALLSEEGAAKIAAAAVEPPPVTRHRVRRGETLSSIARRNDVSVDALRAANDIRGSTIHPGEYLVIPGSGADAATASVAAPRDEISSQLPESQKAAPAQPRVHVVKSGDTLWGVARRYGVTVPALAAANGISTQTPLSLGARLEIPGTAGGAPPESTPLTYHVRRGDTLSEIAEKFNVSVRQLMTWNRIRQSTSLRAGQRLVVYVDPRRVSGG
jgi:membrane-bound lytic murein transglycosylase D